jgi:hypothetical protein
MIYPYSVWTVHSGLIFAYIAPVTRTNGLKLLPTVPRPALSDVWSGINFQPADKLIDVSRDFGSDDDVDTDGADDIMLPVEATLQRNTSTNMPLKMRKSLEHDWSSWVDGFRCTGGARCLNVIAYALRMNIQPPNDTSSDSNRRTWVSMGY